MKRLVCYMAALTALACGSCGNPNNLHPVSGTVLYKGKPAVGAVVFFQRRAGDLMNEHTIMGIVQKDGSFTLVCGPYGKGVPAGEYDVLIQWKQDVKHPKGLARNGQDRLNGRYADLKRPRLHAVVKAEVNHLPPLELTD
jgi:hypothetical protein